MVTVQPWYTRHSKTPMCVYCTTRGRS